MLKLLKHLWSEYTATFIPKSFHLPESIIMQEFSDTHQEGTTIADAIIQAASESPEQVSEGNVTPSTLDEFVAQQMALAAAEAAANNTAAAAAAATVDKSHTAGNVHPIQQKWVGNPATANSGSPTPFPKHTPYTPSGMPVPPTPRELPPIPVAVDQLLADVLTWPRTHGCRAEQAFGNWLVGILNSYGFKPKVRALGCLSVEVPHTDGSRSKTMFVAHVDTVDTHDKSGWVDDDGKVMRKAVVYDPSFGLITLDTANRVGNCLGADDGVGVWMMLKMIGAKVPGSYLFTRGEELGRLGASAMVRSPSDSDWLASHHASVEFDRPRTDEVITHQCGGTRCASDGFGQAVADALGLSDHLAYETSKRGVFTDNYDFRGLIRENVNIGVGYTNQHGSGEELDYGHANALLTRVMAIDWDDMPIERVAEIEKYAGGYSGGYSGSRSKRRYDYGNENWQRALYAGMDDVDDEDYRFRSGHDTDTTFAPQFGFLSKQTKNAKVEPMRTLAGTKKRGPGRPRKGEQEPSILQEVLAYGDVDDWVEACTDDPEMAARVIVELAVELAAQQTKFKTINNLLKKRTK